MMIPCVMAETMHLFVFVHLNTLKEYESFLDKR